MYLRYYGFDDYPFSVTPDPAFLYLSASHREALGHRPLPNTFRPRKQIAVM